MALIIGDLSGIEVRVLAALLKRWESDYRIADDIVNGVDTHQRNMDNWGMESRSPTKNGFFALIYGALLKRFAITIGKTVNEAKPFYEKIREDYAVIFDKLMPKVWRWARKKRDYKVYDEKRFLVCQGFVYSMMGNRFHYTDITSRDDYERTSAEREVFNAIIQGTAAGLFKLLTIAGLEKPPVAIFPGAVVHDELICYAYEEDATTACEWLTSIFSTFKLCGVPIKADFHIVNNWSEK
jgi:DNA polymerase I-like protein with 3'-5' exonuclease and polymerase domains